MKIIEEHLVSKTDDESVCEDKIAYNDDFAVVIDGVTSKTGKLIDGKTSGWWASYLISKEINNFARDIICKDALHQLNSCLAKFYREQGIYDKLQNHKKERFGACAAIYSDFLKEIWIIGDCQCLIDDAYYSNPNYYDELLSETRALYLELAIIKGLTFDEIQKKDPGREYILPILRELVKFSNDENLSYSYSIIDGFNTPVSLVKKIKVPSNAKKIVLASDGYPKIFPVLYETEKYLSKVIKEDPMCFRQYKSTKGLKKGNISFDDRAYLSISL